MAGAARGRLMTAGLSLLALLNQTWLNLDQDIALTCCEE
jgi:hypothetical protein